MINGVLFQCMRAFITCFSMQMSLLTTSNGLTLNILIEFIDPSIFFSFIVAYKRQLRVTLIENSIMNAEVRIVVKDFSFSLKDKKKNYVNFHNRRTRLCFISSMRDISIIIQLYHLKWRHQFRGSSNFER